MVFSQNRKILLKPQKDKIWSTFFIALGVAAAFLVPFIVYDKGYFIFFGDFNAQQIPFYKLAHEAVRSGNIFWSWETDLGANFIGSYSFYLLGSPFFWLTIPFPTDFVPYLMGPLLILKFACAALTGYAFLRRFVRNPFSAQIGALLYAFSGFSIYNIFFNHFHEALVVFPLLLLSLELLITENKRGFFAFMVCICAVTNYFFFFGMVVFAVIYFFVRVFSNCIKPRFSRFLVMLFEAVLGLAMSAVILLPAILSIVDNSRVSSINMGWNAIMYGKEQIYLNIIECFFFPPDLPARPVFFPGADVKWSSLGGWLPLFGMVGVFAFCSARKGHWLKRIICVCFVMAMFPILNSAFYAFNTSYYARWFYMPILMMCLATAVAIEDADINWNSAWKWVGFITLAFTLVIGFFPQRIGSGDDAKIAWGLYSQDDSLMYVVRFFITCGISILSLLFIRLLMKIRSSGRLQTFYRSALVLLCIITVTYSAIFVGTGKTHSFSSKEVMIPQLIEGEVTLPDSDNCRVDVYDGVDNTAMYLGLPTINAFHSVVPASIMEFYEFIGITRDVASRPEESYESLRSFLSVKYLLNRDNGNSFLNSVNEPVITGFEYKESQSGYYIYENKNYIPYGFSYDYYMTEEDCAGYTGDTLVRMMLKAILLSDFDALKYSHMLTSINELRSENSYDFSVSITNDDTLVEDCQKLAATSAVSFERDNNGFTATVIREKANLVFFSVPYEAGWSATVNDKEAEIIKVNKGFMAVVVPEGTSIIRFDYKTPGLTIGLYTTVGCAIVLLIYAIIANFVIKNKQMEKDMQEYPEGDALVLKWRDAEFLEQREAQISEEEENKSILDDLPEKNDIPINNKFENGFKLDFGDFEDKEN